MQKTIIVLFFILFFSCSRLPESKGEFNEIIIVASNEDKIVVNRSINQLFSEYINTPIEEPLYKLKWIKPENFNRYLEYSNLLFISLSIPSDSTIDFLVDKFNNTYEEDVLTLHDVYAKNQTLVIFKCDNLVDFDEKLINYNNWLIDNFESNINNKMMSYLGKFKRNSELEELLNDIYNINAQIQEDYLLIKHDKKNNFIWIGRGYPYRWLTFTVFNDSIGIEHVWSSYEQLLTQNMPNVNISDYYKNILFDSDNSIKIQGLYEEEKSETGGPFLSYIYYNKYLERMIAISGFVNNPGKQKNRLVRELDVIIKKIKHEDKNE